MKHNYFLLTAFLLFALSAPIFAQTQMFNSCVENEGEGIQVNLPGSFNTANTKLPDPFKKLNGQRISTKDDWKERRQEILKLAERTIYGAKPAKPASVKGTVSTSQIKVDITEGGKSESFTVSITMPSGTKPANGWPAVISYGGSGATSSVITGQGVAYINYTPTTVGGENANNGRNRSGVFFRIYGTNNQAGTLIAWAWGVSRIIDVIESDPNKLFDPTAIGVTGCSRFGKGPFVAAAFDQRIALAMPMEGGSGGSNAMRVIASTSGAQSPSSAYGEQPWLGDPFNSFTNNANNLPIDMHEVAALIAPRGLLFLDKTPESSDWLCTQASNAAARGAAEVYKALGVGSNIQYISNTGSSGHCAWNDVYKAPVEDFIQKYLKRTKAVSGNTPTFNVSNSSRNPNMANLIDWTTPTLSGELTVGGCGPAPTGFTVSTTVSPAGSGEVTISPKSDNGRYEEGSTVTLTAVAGEEWAFESWAEDATGNTNPLSLTLDKSKNVTAKFKLVKDGTVNLIKNGTFDGVTNWTLNTGTNYGGSAGTFTTANNQATINITATGENTWDPQLVQTGVSLEKGMKYRLTFDASAASPRELEVLLQMAASPYTDYLAGKGGNLELTATPQTFKIEFEMTSDSDPGAQLAFNIGQSMQRINISNVKLIYIADVDPSIKVTLTLNANGGTVTPGSISVDEGAAVGTLPVPNRPGYSFEGWFDDKGVEYTANTKLTANATVTASWKATGENLSEEELLELIDDLKGQVAQLTSDKENLQQLLDECKGLTSNESLRASGILTIYPNPVNANSVLNIESANLKAGDKMEIFDMQGRLISVDVAADDAVTSIKIGSLSQGTYLLRLAGQRGVKFEVK